jgi:hypothetical protein
LTKKTTIGNCQGILNVIQHALTIANFVIDDPALLEINHKIAVMGGGDSDLAPKSASLCSSPVWFLGNLRATKS